MNTRRFGRTDIQVSEVVIGAGWVGGILIDPNPDVMRRALRMSLDAGINWIDTAESYGAGVSETNVGWLVEELDAAARPGISTKARLDIESSETIASQLDRKIDASLKRLRLDSVDLYQLHNRIVAETDGQDIGVDDVLGAGGVADQLERLREDGRIRHIGITALGEVDPLIRATNASHPPRAMANSNATHNTFNSRVDGGSPYHRCAAVTCAVNPDGVFVDVCL